MALPLLLLSVLTAQAVDASRVTPPILRKFVQAEYPPMEAVRTATVVLALDIDEEGKVTTATVVESEGRNFDAAAVAAALEFEFQPATFDGKPISVRIRYRYRFVVEVRQVDVGPQINFQGTVQERYSKKPIARVLVTIVELGTSTVADNAGGFRFWDVPPATYRVGFEREGFITATTEQAIEKEQRIDMTISLYEVDEESDEVDEEEVIRAARIKKEVVATRLESSVAEKIPGTGGDMVRGVETIAGVGRAAAGSSSLVIWGASPSDTRAYVDGILVPRLFHLGGGRSVLASNLIASVELAPGGYGPEHGRAIGGLVKVESTELIEEGIHGHAAVDFFDVSLGTRAKVSEHAAVSIAARRSILGETVGGVIDDRSRELIPIPSFWDYQAKLSYEPTSGDRMDVLVFGADDKTERQTPSSDPTRTSSEDTHATFHRVGLHLERLLDDGASIELIPWIGVDRTVQTLSFGEFPVGVTQTVLKGAVRLSERRRLGSWATLRMGIDLEGDYATIEREGALSLPAREGDITTFGLPPGDRVNSDEWRVVSAGAGLYALVDLRFLDETLSVEPGIRFEPSLVEGQRVLPTRSFEPRVGYTDVQLAVDPRIRAAWAITPVFTINGAVGLYHQPPNPSDMSPVFGSPILGLSKAVHSLAGVLIEPWDTTSAEVTGFLVNMSGLAVRSSLPTPADARAITSEGTGRNMGVQLTLRHKVSEDLFGWITYSLMRAERRDHPEEPVRLFDSDQTHTLSLVASWAPGAGFVLGGRFRYTTGFPRTPVVGAYYNAKAGLFEPIYGAQNSVRIPDFIELSLRVGWSRELDFGTVEAFLDVQNVLGRQNAEEVLYNSDFTERGFISGFPVLPVLGAKVEF